MEYKKHIPANQIRQILFLAAIVSIGIILYRQMTFMLSGFLGAVTLFMILRLSMYKLVYEKKVKKWLAATLLMTASFVCLILPFLWVGYILVNKISPMIQNPELLTKTADQIQNFINTKFKIDILSENYVNKITESITRIVPPLISSTTNILLNIVMAYFLLWFMLINASQVEIWLKKNLPFMPENRHTVLAEVKESVMSNAIGLPILGAIQGVFAIVGYWIFDVPDPVLWGIVTGICSFVPFVGTMAAWVPIAILSFASGDTQNGIGLVFWGLVVIGMSDNIIRIFVQKKLGEAHPMVTVFGVIVGLNMFGFLGLIFGPLLISLFLLLVKIYIKEFISGQES